jgi:hypothetical protein
MASSFDGVKCTIQNGKVRMHLDNGCVNIPAQLLTKSRFLSEVLASFPDLSVTSDFIVPAPEQWLQAWVARYVSEEGRLGCDDSTDLINCLMVCLSLQVDLCRRLHSCFVVCSCCICRICQRVAYSSLLVSFLRDSPCCMSFPSAVSMESAPLRLSSVKLVKAADDVVCSKQLSEHAGS